MSKEQDFKRKLEGKSILELEQMAKDFRGVTGYLLRKQTEAAEWTEAFDYRERRKTAERKLSWTLDVLSTAYAKRAKGDE